METTPAFRGLSCTDCGETFADEHGRCPDCGAPLDPTYDYDAVPDVGAAASARDLDALRPFAAPLSADEGGTPLVDAPSLAGELDVGRVRLKDEGRNPTGSFVDRGMALAVTAATDAGTEPLALAAAGDAGQSAAAYAGRADLRAYAFVPSRAPFANKAMVNVHGAEMRVSGGRYPDAVAALEADLATDHYSLQEFTSPYRHEGAKTVAHEVAAALDWTVPDAVVVPVGTGELLVGVEKGFRELRDLGLTEAVPRLVAAQPEGCAPVVEAHEEGLDDPAVPEYPDTICGELEIPDPAGGRLALRALDRSGGEAVAVPDDDALESAVAATKTTAVEVGTAGGVAVAAAWALADTFDADADVTVVNPATGLKTPDVLRSHLMGQGV
ncbi:MAG: pyridoxal-phosphate dependent enzyme [Haloferacaceae archaeon]